MYGKSENIDSNSQGSVTITPNNFSDDGCYIRSLARPNKGVMGVIEVNSTTFPSLKATCSFFTKVFPIFFQIIPNFRDFAFFPKFSNDGCYRGLWRAQITE